MPQEQRGVTLSTITSTYLLEGLKKPDNRTIWQQFVARYRPLLVSYGRRLGLREEEAEDAAQTTLMEFSTAFQVGKFDREKGRLRKWLFGIARNQIKNTFKKRPREVQVGGETEHADLFAKVSDEDRWEELWEQEWRQAVLRQCLDEIRTQFDAKTVEAFELFASRGQPAKQVADQLEMSENAVFLAKHKILKRIRELVPQMEEVY